MPLSLAWWFSRRRTPDDALGLLALLFLLRCLLDPVDNAYYHVPFLLSLTAWEGLVRRGPPLVSILSSVTIYYAINKAGWTDDLVLRNALYLAATLPVAASAGGQALCQTRLEASTGRWGRPTRSPRARPSGTGSNLESVA